MLAARGQRDIEHLRGLPGIVEEQLEEIAHPVEQQAILRLGLEREVLGHHRGGAGGRGNVHHPGLPRTSAIWKRRYGSFPLSSVKQPR